MISLSMLAPERLQRVILVVGLLGLWSLPCAGVRAADVGETAVTGAADSEHADYDPLERVNRKIFRFNDTLDVWVLEPIATGWDTIAPKRVQTSIANFFQNLRFPVVFANNLLQGKVQPSASTMARFFINTTLGFVGFFDPATDFGLPRSNEDFGQTLGWWGVRPGPYLVLPIFGPSNPRDTGGLAVDYGLSLVPFFVNGWVLFGAGSVNTVNTRSLILADVRDAKASAVDYYALIRNAYLQRREALVNDGPDSTRGTETDLYDVYITNTPQ